ncbi:UvrD-helicase domain-containing protein [Alicyclobacillus sp.]|uniref:UvrD-helicase domain-containing protein n=1 Tax=Alicyclobacillus sp. TaxID=61169 RepID=UPI0025B84EBF|nr:UvrD-helicase domain-containing protein [Alicyclobacillus sp.]MCL6516953.1 UvrD-helicase domain-containing protein [Alicyclobacillus sp.]
MKQQPEERTEAGGSNAPAGAAGGPAEAETCTPAGAAGGPAYSTSDAARDRWSPKQREAIETRGENVLVSAGAGSGKTTVLVERVMRCVLGPDAVDLDRLLLVTFTEAAAGEMRQRIAARLESIAKEAMRAGDAARMRQAARQLDLVERAQISTLHSFCMEVVRRNFLHLGLEPVFDILPEDERIPLRARVFEDVLEAWLESDRREAVRAAARGLCADDLDRLWPLVDRLDTFAQSQPDPVMWLAQVREMYVRAKDTAIADWPWTEAFLQWAARRIEEAGEVFAEALRMASAHAELDGYRRDLEQALSATREAARGLADWDGVAAAVHHLRAMLNGKRISAPNRPEFAAVKDLRKRGRDRVQEVLDVLGRGEAALRQDVLGLAPAVTALVDLTGAFAQRYEAAKRRRGVLDFSDLEQYAHRVLADPSTGEARRLSAQFAEIFVDEYQDTSPIQDAIVRAIARPAGNVFVVGDVKQSIYRFRMAEPGLFLARYRGSAGGRVIDLTDNYRSRPEVVEAVNYLFTLFFTPAFGGVNYRDGGAMRASAPYPDAPRATVNAEAPPHSQAPSNPAASNAADEGAATLAGPVEVHLVERAVAAEEGEGDGGEDLERPGAWAEDDEDARVADADVEGLLEEMSHLEKEAWVAAHRIQALLGRIPGQPGAQVWDRDLGCHRPVRPRDIVVLLRAARGKVNVFLDVFAKAGIPAYGATTMGFYGALEVQWLLALLTVIDNPRHDLAFVTLLRSPLAGFSDEDLARIRLFGRGPFYDAWRRAAAGRTDAWAHLEDTGAPGWQAALTEKVRAFHDRLRAWRALARRATTEEVLRRALEDTGFLAYVSGMPGGQGRRANVEALLTKARVYDRRHPDGVFGFIRRANEALERNVDEGEARTLGENEDVVRVMTIHQSKGLEYPVVLVADLGKQFRVDDELPLHRALGVGAAVTDMDTEQRWPSIPSIAIRELELTETLAEEARVLYVAMTRARERLILIGSGKDLARQAARWGMVAQAAGESLPLYAMLRAKSYLDWLGPALLRHKDGAILRRLAEEGGAADDGRRGWGFDHPARFSITLWNTPSGRPLPVPLPDRPAEPGAGGPVGAGTAAFRPEVFASRDPMRIRAHLRELAGMPAAGREAESPAPWSGWTPGAGRVRLPGKLSATDLRRIWTHHLRAEGMAGARQEPVHPAAAQHLLDDPLFTRADSVTPRERGVLFHRLMQRVPFSETASRAEVEATLDALIREGVLSERERDPGLVEDAIAFLSSPLGRRLARAHRVWREQPFFHRLPMPGGLGGVAADGFDADAPDPFVVVQGVIDCLAETEDGWVLVDYKTDRIAERDLMAVAREYEAQVAVYVQAVRAALGGAPVEAYLYFVRPRAIVPVTGVALDDVIAALADSGALRP